MEGLRSCPAAVSYTHLDVYKRQTYDYGDMWVQFYDSVESNFDKTLRHIVLYDLWDKYDSRIKQCLRWASPCGWGFPDALNDMYEEMKAHNEELRKKYRNFKMPINAD